MTVQNLMRFLVPGLALAVLVGVFAVLTRGEERKYVTASFPRTISLYEGSDVRVLGVPVGEIESVEPQGTSVKVTMWYDADVRVPVDAEAVIISPSIVGDRFVQLTPAFTGGEELPADAVLDLSRTSTPLELDEIYRSIDDLTVALGPQGANSDGALTRLLETTAENFGGQGEKFHQTIEDFGKFSGTLEGNKEELFGAAAALEGFISTLAENDQTVRRFNQSLSRVSEMLAGERDELSASLRNLAVAMGEVSSFVRDNREILGRNIAGLNRVVKVLVKQRSALDDILKDAPLALNNLAGTYNPQAGTLDTRANMGNLVTQLENDPALLLCTLVGPSDPSGSACDVIEQALGRGPALTRADVGPREQYDSSLGGLVEVQP